MQRGRIGVTTQELTPDLAEALGVDIERGALVSRVKSGSPAEASGVKAGDVIVAVNGSPVESSRDLRNSIGLIRAGQEAEVEIQRERHRIRLVVRIDDARPGGAGPMDVPPPLEGARLRDLEQGDPAYGRIKGVIAAEVAHGSRAARNGIRPGDIIVAVNRRRVRDAEEFGRALEQADSVLALNIVRGNGQVFIVIH